MISLNNQLVCTPFKKNHNEPVMKGKVALNNDGGTLEELTVLVDAHIVNGEFESIIKAGEKIYVKGSSFKQAWATTKYSVPPDFENMPYLVSGGVTGPTGLCVGSTGATTVKFILVPFTEVIIKI